MKNRIWLTMAFVFMFIVAPMLMIMTMTVNSALPMGTMLLLGTPLLAVACTVLAAWYLKQNETASSVPIKHR